MRALREAGLWERFSSLRRYARDWGLWQEWLHGPIARHYERLGEATFVQAVREALEGLATRPDLQRPLLWFEKVLQKAAPPPPSGESVVVPSLQSWEELENGELLRLPDGRVGYFAGWTAGGTKGFLEVEGTSYVLPRELLLQAEVLA
ncbi:hypothetical protein [Thermus filiformis]|uniref:hypothetical protein n=1 Tax=Thermus filiformis TaxID=276 RepID=UPI001F2E8D69|nr:hypothetical protein [Thermus filiformis]